MYSWKNFIDKWKRYGIPEKREIRDMIITAVILGFIFSFRDWGVETFNPTMGVLNFILSILLVIIAFVPAEITHRSMALLSGYRSQYKMWIIGLVFGLVLIFITNGYWYILAPGALIITELNGHRIGRFGALSLKHVGWIAMSGSIANMFFAVIMKLLFVGTGLAIFHKAMIINIWIALFNMIPIPPYNGSKTFFGSRFVYAFVVGFLIGCTALLYTTGGIWPILAGLGLGLIFYLVFFVFIEKKF